MSLSKEDEKLLRRYAKILPVIMEDTHEIHKMTGDEMIEMGYVEYEGFKIDPKGKYLYKYPVQVAMNHYRRLKRSWLADGVEGLTEYFKLVAAAIEAHKNVKIES